MLPPSASRLPNQTSVKSPARPQPLLVALAGPTSSGKTTLASAIKAIFNPPLHSHSAPQNNSTSKICDGEDVQSIHDNQNGDDHNVGGKVLEIIHLDDLYLKDSRIPLLEIPQDDNDKQAGSEIQNWDTPAAFDYARYLRVLEYIQSHGGEVPWHIIREALGGILEPGQRGGGGVSGNDTGTAQANQSPEKEDGFKEGEEKRDGVHGPISTPGTTSSETLTLHSGIQDADVKTMIKEAEPDDLIRRKCIQSLRSEISTAWPSTLLSPSPSPHTRRKIILIEGLFPFLPPSPSASTTHNFQTIALPLNTRLLLRSTRDLCQRRRESRNGYVTLAGFWTDPPGYFDRVVWPGWVGTWGTELAESHESDNRGPGPELESRNQRENAEAGREGKVKYLVSRTQDTAGKHEEEEGEGMRVDIWDISDGRQGMEEALAWIVERIKAGLESIVATEKEEGTNDEREK